MAFKADRYFRFWKDAFYMDQSQKLYLLTTH